MIKEELLAKVASDTMVSRGTIDTVVNSFIENIEKALVDGDNVVIRGFGEFRNVERKAKVARNIKAGTPIYIPAHIEPDFKVSDALKKKCYKEV